MPCWIERLYSIRETKLLDISFSCILTINTTLWDLNKKIIFTTITAQIKRWRLKLYESISDLITFSIRNNTQPLPLAANGINVERKNKFKYIGKTLDVKINWKGHVKIKYEEFEICYRKLYCMLGKMSKRLIQSNLFIYNQIIKSVQSSGVVPTKPNMQCIQTKQK